MSALPASLGTVAARRLLQHFEAPPDFVQGSERAPGEIRNSSQGAQFVVQVEHSFSATEFWVARSGGKTAPVRLSALLLRTKRHPCRLDMSLGRRRGDVE